MLTRRVMLGTLLTLGLAVVLLQTTADQQSEHPRPTRPHIVLINLDDADWDLLSEENLATFFPNIRANLVEQGLAFTNLHVADPVCGPSRGSLFRGQYPHNTGIVENRLGWQIFYDRGYTDAEIGQWMRDAGYRTGQDRTTPMATGPTWKPSPPAVSSTSPTGPSSCTSHPSPPI